MAIDTEVGKDSSFWRTPGDDDADGGGVLKDFESQSSSWVGSKKQLTFALLTDHGVLAYIPTIFPMV